MAVALTALVVAGCLAYSLFVGPVAAVKVQPGDWIADQANVLSESTEDSLRSYDQSFDKNYGSVIAVATVSSTRGWDMEDYALKLADQWELGAKDLVLLLDIGGKDAYLLGGSAWTDLEPSELLNQTMAADFFSGNYDSAVLSLFSAMSGWYPDHGGYARSDPYADYNQQSHGNSSSFGGFSMILRIILIILVIYLIIAAIERARYRRWYRDYGAMTAPSVVFTPIFPWHRPGSSWYNRMGHRPPPPPRPGPGGPRPGGPGYRSGGPAPRPNSYRPAPGPARPSSP
ncbi:MAG: TPM domain-containing protein, partial [Oscillospiraceae bacterium]|nr:TPM domain-containing protein [Oscillospiraceae bacterium]